MRTIDLRSDTITLPTDEMRQAMYEAELGDDVFGEDPTINRLEEMSAHMLGKEAALFTTSGTMSNLISVLAHTRPGNEILVGSEAHMFWNEVGGASALGGVIMHMVPNTPDGQIKPSAISESIRAENIHYPQTALLCLENTHNRCGGTVLTPEYTHDVAQLAHQHSLQVHLDGARIFNASIALGVPASELAKAVDSVCFCLSKGLSAPVGSLICGNQEFINRTRKWRKMLGGGMRQAGVIAAAGIVALQKMVNRLAEDHVTAKQLANGLTEIPGISINPEKIQTNIVIFETPSTISGPEFIQRMGAQGVRLSHTGGQRVRAVTHRMVNATDIDEALGRIKLFLR